MKILREKTKFFINNGHSKVRKNNNLLNIPFTIEKRALSEAEVFVDLGYINLGDRKKLRSCFEYLERLEKRGVKIKVTWYLTDNDGLNELAFDFMSEANFKFSVEQKDHQKILLVHPNRAITEFMILAMMRKNIYIDVAKDGKEAKRYLANNDYQLVITELELDLYSGWEISHDVKEKTNSQLLILSDRFLINRAKMTFPDDKTSFMNNPIDLNQLIQSIDNTFKSDPYERLAS